MNHFITNLTKYRGLLFELVMRDLKLKYRRSVFGMLWTLLNPLLMMTVQYIVFSRLFSSGLRGSAITNYPVYLLTGSILFSFYSEASNLSMSSVIMNSSLIRKVYIPKYIFPISKTIFSLVNFSFSLLALIIVMVVTRSPISFSILLFPIPIFLILVFSLGAGLFLSAVSVYFRDVMYIYSIVILAWTYFTPLFYPISILGDLKWIEYFNPLYYYIEFFRDVVMSNQLPNLIITGGCVLFSLLSLAIGLGTFRKLQENFILYV